MRRLEKFSIQCTGNQAKFSAEELRETAGVLDLPIRNLQSVLGDHWWPDRGLELPTGPIIYRLYESVRVYAHPIKAIIHKKGLQRRRHEHDGLSRMNRYLSLPAPSLFVDSPDK
ncbi:Cyanate hydratase [Mycena venus]|uniref:Cyanate hydratase n=1 Tax=Mycena venus TaxID=2733690 RepID=A0A8H6Y197_9AGAR|nr:Cyanate hydratase [Mycena venus]